MGRNNFGGSDAGRGVVSAVDADCGIVVLRLSVWCGADFAAMSCSKETSYLDGGHNDRDNDGDGGGILDALCILAVLSDFRDAATAYRGGLQYSHLRHNDKNNGGDDTKTRF